MKLRAQHLLVVVPLFAGLAAASGTLAWRLARTELGWGFSERLSSAAVAVAAHLDGTAIESLRRAAQHKDGAGTVIGELERIGRWGIVNRVTVTDAVNRRMLADVDFASTNRVSRESIEGAAAPPRVAPLTSLLSRAVGPDLISRVSHDAYAVSEIEEIEPGRQSLAAFAPVRDESGALAAVVGVESDVPEYGRGLDGVFYDALVIGVIIVLLGICAAESITAVVTRRLRRLTRMAVALASGQGHDRAPASVISEVSDLRDTFETMTSILDETLEKTRRRVRDAEGDRSDRTMCRAFNNAFELRAPIVSEALKASVLSARDDSPYDFVEVRQGSAESFVCIGSVSRDLPTTAALSERSALAAALHAGLARGCSVELLADLGRLFNAERIEVVQIGAAFSCGARFSWNKDGVRRAESVSVPEGACLLVETLPGPAAADAARCAQLLGRYGGEVLLAGMLPAVRAEDRGAVIAVTNVESV